MDGLDLAQARQCSSFSARPRVERELVVGTEIVPVRALRCGQALGALDAAAEAVGRRAQRQLRVDLELAREVDGGEQHVADLVEALPRGPSAASSSSSSPRTAS